jgi:APA family basic amino acid/polyamine antiporter
MKPASMMSQLGSPAWLLLVWVLAGLITLCGALSNAELATLYPETGGQYVFFDKIFGKRFAFLYGWAALAVFNTGGNASVAYVCSNYAAYFIQLPNFAAATEQAARIHIPLIGDIYPLENFGIKSLTIVIIILFTWINYYSLQWGASLQRWLTWIKLVAIAILLLGVMKSSVGNLSHFSQTLPSKPAGWAMVAAWMAALSGAFWGYEGWNNITFVSGEIKEPQRNIPLSLFFGLLICTLVYVSLSAAFVYILSPSAMAGSSWVASDAARLMGGVMGAAIITGMVVVSTLGATNGNILSTARVTYALGASNRLFSWAGEIHPRFNTPGNALWLNAIWTIILIISGSFDMLTDMLVFVSWFFYGMSALGVILLRIRMPDAPRPYKVPGYPYIPLIFILFTVCFLLATLVIDIQQYLSGKTHLVNSLLGVVITLLGLPLYYWSKSRN